MKTQLGVVVFLRRGNEVLLARKKRGFGAGYWNGPGGKVEAGESIEAAAIRETKEEIGVTVSGLRQVAHIQFHYPENETSLWDGHVFMTESWEGQPVETTEMAPAWFRMDEVPYDEMWDDDRYWLPRVLNGEKIEAEFTFDEHEKVIDFEVRPQ